jgi:ribosomal protein S14
MRKLRALRKAGKLRRPRKGPAQETRRSARRSRRAHGNPVMQWDVTWYTTLPAGRGTDQVMADTMDDAVAQVKRRHARATIVSATSAGAGSGFASISCAVCGRPFAGHAGARLCPHCFRDEAAARHGGSPGDIRDRY